MSNTTRNTDITDKEGKEMMKETKAEPLVFEQVCIGGLRVYAHAEARVVSVRLNAVTQTALFTPAEYQIIALLLKGQVIADEECEQVLGMYSQETIPLTRHIANIRSFRVSRYGYVLLPEQLRQTSEGNEDNMTGWKGEQA